MTEKFWIEKGWGDQVDNVTIDDIKIAIQETINMDDEHGAFWSGNYDNEYILEIHKDLSLFFVMGEDPSDQMRKKLSSWTEVERLYQLFINSNYEQIKIELTEE
jgi:hypothetical protein